MEIDTVNHIIFLSSFIEIFLQLIAYIVAGFCFYILWKHPVFHVHLVRIYHSIFITYFLAQMCRLVVMIDRLYKNNYDHAYILLDKSSLLLTLATTFQVYFMTAMYTGLAAALYERILATVYLETYEKQVSIRFYLSCSITIITAPGVVTFLIYKGYLDFNISGLILLCGNVIGYIILTILHQFNTRRYHLSLIKSDSYTLSQRFQLQENLRTAKKIKKIAIVLFTLNCCMGASLLISKLNGTCTRKLAYVVLHYFILFYGFTFPLFGITTNPYCKVLQMRLKTRFFIKPKVISPAISITNHQRNERLFKEVRSFTGRQMIFTADEERNLYFQQLQNVWN